MFKYLYHFTRTPPGLGAEGLVPRSNDLAEEFVPLLTPEARELYGDKNFIFTIPIFALEAWERTNQLRSLFEMLVKLEWFKYSVEQWRIDTTGMDLSSTLIRETYFISPEALGVKSDLELVTEAQRRQYNEAYSKMINSVKFLLSYQNDFINPEVLLPFGIKRSCLTLEKVID